MYLEAGLVLGLQHKYLVKTLNSLNNLPPRTKSSRSRGTALGDLEYLDEGRELQATCQAHLNLSGSL